MKPAVLLIPLAVVIVGAVSIGSPIIAVIFLPIVGLLLVWGRATSRRTIRDPGWSAPPEAATLAAVPGPQPGTTGSGDLVAALAWVEGRHLLASPAFGAGIGFCVLLFVLFTFVWGGENTAPWSENLQTTPWLVHPVVGLTVLGAHRAVTRGRRDGADEVLDTCPTGWTTRTLGHLGSGWLPAAVAAVFLAAMIIGISIQGELVHGPISQADVLDVITALLLPVGGVTLGVALGRWLHHTFVPVVAVIGVAFATTTINGIGGHGWNPYTALSTAPTIEGKSPVFTVRPAGFHLLWIVALIALMAALAVLRHQRTRAVQLAGVGAVALLAVAGLGATRPLSVASAQRIADLVSHPENYQVCADASERVEVCTFEHHREMLASFTALMAPVANALPPSAGSFTLRHRYLDDLAKLPPEVRSLLDGVDLFDRPRNEIALADVDDIGFDPLGTPLTIALGAVGLPTVPDEHHLPAVVSGQARGVVALWLAVRGVEAAQRSGVLTAYEPNAPDAYDRGLPRNADHTCSIPSVVWSAQDLAAARAIVVLPDARVSEVLDAEWRHWVGATTTTDELLDVLGLPPMGPYDRVVPRP
ncbi:MAG: hypothetical protein WD691_07005, partial [Acidimicrobiales bacterium]